MRSNKYTAQADGSELEVFNSKKAKRSVIIQSLLVFTGLQGVNGAVSLVTIDEAVAAVIKDSELAAVFSLLCFAGVTIYFLVSLSKYNVTIKLSDKGVTCVSRKRTVKRSWDRIVDMGVCGGELGAKRIYFADFIVGPKDHIKIRPSYYRFKDGRTVFFADATKKLTDAVERLTGVPLEQTVIKLLKKRLEERVEAGLTEMPPEPPEPAKTLKEKLAARLRGLKQRLFEREQKV